MSAENVIQMNLSPARALQLIREISADSCKVFYTQHAEKRMNQRKITRTQVMRCLQKGSITEGPARGTRGNWELKMEVYSAGDPVAVVAALENDGEGNYILVITTY